MRILIGRPAIVALALATALSLVALDQGAAGQKGDKLVVAPTALTAPAAPTAPTNGPATDPAWRKHVFVVTDSVMLGAKDAFIKTMRDAGWDVTFTGRVSLFMHNGLRDYVLPARNTGPVAVVALGYNSSWEKNRREYWAGIFDKQAEEMIAALKERGARKIVWVLLRELTPAMAAGARDMREYNSYAFYLPWVNERLRALQSRHPEITLADWTSAATRQGLTEGMIHLSSQGAQLMASVVKSSIVDQPAPGTPGVAVAAARPPQLARPAPEKPRVVAVAEPPRVAAPQAPRPRVIRIAEIRIGQLPPIEPARQEAAAAPPRAMPVALTAPAEGPRIVQSELPSPIAARWPRAEETRVAEARPTKQPAIDPNATTIDIPEPPTRREREGMIALTRMRWASVVMLGDSMTERGPWAEITGCFYVANRGIGGDLSSGVLARVDDALRLKPSAVFLMIGINDISRNVPIPTIVGNVRRTIERINAAGAKVYLMLVLPVSRGYVPHMNPRVAELNAAYVTLARETNATVVDFRRDLSDEGALRTDMTVDGLHLNPAGYRAWSDAIAPLVQRHCQSASAPAARVSAAASELTTGSIVQPPPEAPAAPPARPASIAVAEPEPSVTIPAPARGEWMIQVGAYPDAAQAKERIREAQAVGKRVLPDGQGLVEKTLKAGREWFRARFAGFDKAKAAAACGHFKANAIDCVIVRD